MRAKIILCETATAHPDHTFSLLRGGITRVNSTQVPIPFGGTIVIYIHFGEEDFGKHEFKLSCIDLVNKKDILPNFGGNFEAEKKVGEICMILGFKLKFPEFDAYKFCLTVDGRCVDDWDLTVCEKKEGGQNVNAH